MSKILVIDDDLSLRELIELILKREGHEIILAENGLQGFKYASDNNFDLIISDIRMPEMNGLELLKKLRLTKIQTPLILISAYATSDTAVAAMREGAYDFIPKPFKPEDLITVVESALAYTNVEKEKQALDEMVAINSRFGHLVGASPAILQVYDLIKRAAQTNTSILITGESGTGKELVARAVHENSPRADHSFVAINCGGMPEQLVESELFGYKKGAFTGANTDKVGLVSIADSGTLFLDELAELTMPMQVKLLRFVQERTFRPVGGNKELTADVRFIAATNKNLESEIIAGNFREDLYYRLNVINIHLPPLRERKEDIPLLAHFFLEKYSKAQGKDLRKLSTYALDVLSKYPFPGNVRELENIIERSVALEQSNIILPESLRLANFKQSAPVWPSGNAATNSEAQLNNAHNKASTQEPQNLPEKAYVSSDNLPSNGLDEYLACLEVYYLFNALIQSGGARGRAASLLGISPWRLRIRLVAYNLAALNPMELAKMSGFPKPDLPVDLIPDWTGQQINLDQIIFRVEKYFITIAMEKSNGNKTEASALLGLSRRSFQHRIERSGYEANDGEN